MSFRIYLHHPIAVNNDAEVLSIFANPITEELTPIFGGLIVNGNVDIVGDVNIIGQIENKYAEANNSIVIGYDPVALAGTALDSVIIGDEAYGLVENANPVNVVAVGSNARKASAADTDSVFVGEGVAQVLPTQINTSVIAGANALQALATSGVISNTTLVGANALTAMASNASSLNNLTFVGANILPLRSTNVGSLASSTMVGSGILALQASGASPILQNTMVGSFILQNLNGAVSVSSNTMIGNDHLPNCTTATNIDQMTIVGQRCFVNRTFSGVVQNSVVLGLDSGGGAASLNYTQIDGVTLCGVRSGYDNKECLDMKDVTAVGVGAMRNCTGITAFNNCSFLGKNAVATNAAPGTAFNRTAIGGDSEVTRDNSIVLGSTGTAGKQGTTVGVGLRAPSAAMLQVRGSANASDPTNLLYAETSAQVGVAAINPTGMSLTGQFQLNYYTNNSILVGKTRNVNSANFASNNVMVGDRILNADIVDAATIRDATLLGANILQNLTGLASNPGSNHSDVLVGYNIMGSVTNFGNSTFVDSNVMVGSNILLNTDFFAPMVGVVSRNVIIGDNALGKTAAGFIHEFDNNTIVGALALRNNAAMTGINGVACIGRNALTSNAALERLLDTSAVGLNAGSSCSFVNYLNSCVFLGTAARATNSVLGTAEFRTAIGVNSVVQTDNAMVLGRTGSGGDPGTKVGVGISAPYSLLHVRGSVNGTDPTTHFLVESTGGTALLSASNAGVQIYNPAGTFNANVTYQLGSTASDLYRIPRTFSGNATGNIVTSYNIAHAGGVAINWTPSVNVPISLAPSRSGNINITLGANIVADSLSTGSLIFTGNTAMNAGDNVLLTLKFNGNDAQIREVLTDVVPTGFTIKMRNYAAGDIGNGFEFTLYYLVI